MYLRILYYTFSAKSIQKFNIDKNKNSIYIYFFDKSASIA